jgi:GNAT superfamily N-acetyltransferase
MSKSDSVTIQPAATPDDLTAARTLFRAYADSLGFSLCFENFDDELAALPGIYAPPKGALLIARKGASVVGCVGLRPLDAQTAEMKRLYLTQEARGLGLGRKLCEALIAAAKKIGYTRMRLDTVPGKMDSAITLYRALGFRTIPPYNASPIPGIIHMELTLG